MKYFFILNHPAHFHLFKNTISSLKRKGHKCFIYIRPKDVLVELLKESGLEYKILSYSPKNRKFILASSIIELIKKDFKLAREVKKYKPNLLIGTDWAITHVGSFFNIPSLVFNEDDTIATPENKVFYPFAKTLIIPECVDKGMWGQKRVSYNGYHELAYLHPNHFTPDAKLVNDKLCSNKPFVIIRMVRLTASHDAGKKGLSLTAIQRIIAENERDFNFIVSIENNVIPELEKYIFKFNPAIMHHFLAKAELVISDSQTMIAESAVLGTPSVRYNDFVGLVSTLEELEHKFDLTYGFRTNEPEKLLQKVNEILATPDIKIRWKGKKQKMINMKIDVSAFITWFIEQYPESIKILHQDPTYQYNFR